MGRQFQCPLCDSTFGSEGSVKAHITRMTDEIHKGESGPDYAGEIETTEVSDDTGSAGSQSTDSTSSSGAGVVPESERFTDSGDSACCSNPDLEGEAGDVYQLENGDRIRLEAGDSICLNCDTIHE